MAVHLATGSAHGPKLQSCRGKQGSLWTPRFFYHTYDTSFDTAIYLPIPYGGQVTAINDNGDMVGAGPGNDGKAHGFLPIDAELQATPPTVDEAPAPTKQEPRQEEITATLPVHRRQTMESHRLERPSQPLRRQD